MFMLDEQFDQVLLARRKENPKIQTMEDFLGLIINIEDDYGTFKDYEVVQVESCPDEGEDAILLYMKLWDEKRGSQLPERILH